MTINLSISPLVGSSSLNVYQKCLLPPIPYTNSIRCGTWAKCMLATKHPPAQQQIGSVICQIYKLPRESSSQCAFTDVTVTNGIESFDYQNTVITELYPLTESQVGAIELIVNVTKDYLKNSIRKLRLQALANSCKILLQAYCLTADAKVTSKALTQIGIKSIQIKVQNLADNECFSISDETEISICDVQLDREVLQSTYGAFHMISYSKAAELELNNLLERSKQSQQFGCSNNALLVGPTGCGKSALIANFVKREKCNYFRITIQDILSEYPGESESKLRTIFECARKFVKHLKPKASTLLHIEDVHQFCDDDSSSSLRLCAQLCALLDELNHDDNGIICLATTTDSRLLHKSLHIPGRFHYEIEIESLNDKGRRELFALMFKERFPWQQLDEKLLDFVADCTAGYVAADLALLVRAIEQSRLQGNNLEMAVLVKDALTKSMPSSLRGADVTVTKVVQGFETIGGMAELKKLLQFNILTGLRRIDAFKRFGLSLPKGILLYGPPGCAKTTIAKCLAAEAKMTFIATSGAEVYSPYVGCAEKFISKLFDTARRHAPCLIFLDEIDTLVGNRSTSSNDVETRILSTLLTEMDGIVHANAAAYILVVAASNRPNMIDDALLRPGRFDQLIHVPAPDYNSRLSIFEMLRQRMPFAKDCVLEDLAARTANFSGADICNACNEAAMCAFQRDFNAEEITSRDFEQVLTHLTPSLTQRQIDMYKNFKKH